MCNCPLRQHVYFGSRNAAMFCCQKESENMQMLKTYHVSGWSTQGGNTLSTLYGQMFVDI